MGHKLSILKRQHDKTGWHPSSQYDIPSVQQIKVDGSGKGKSLNAIPSPFARLHLFETAFEMVFQDLINHTKFAGGAYNKIVSDCFDVFELIYNWESHIKEGKNLEILTWVKNTELNDLLKSNSKKHKLLGETLNTFLKEEPAFHDFEKCLIVRYNGKVIAGTSPLTGFFTTPDELNNFELLKPLSQVAYFSRPIPFEQRKSEIKKYIFDFFEKNENLRLSEFTQGVRNFLEWHNDQGNIPSTGIGTELKDILINGIAFEIFGKKLQTAKSIGTEYFEKQIVRLNYRLNDDCFILPKNSNNERTYDYLLPLTTSFFHEYSAEQIKNIVSITETAHGTVEVAIAINGKTVSKKYQEKPIHDTEGKIIDLYNEHQININLGIFPFLKIIEQQDIVDFNDFYRVMVTIQDNYFKYSNNNFTLHFGKDNSILDNGPIYNITRIERTILERDKNNLGNVGSTYYGLNTCFDFIQIELPPIDNGKTVKCAIVPFWKERKIGNNQLDFSVDFGTTSTFIAYTNDPTHQSEPRPIEFTEHELPVALLNKPSQFRPGIRQIDRFEERSLPNFLESIQIQITEFLPSIIKRKEKYEFPIRTVLFQKRSLASSEKNILSNANISFIYQKPEAVYLDPADQEFLTNLKWNIKTNEDFESSIRVYIEEVFILIRTKILMNDGDPRKSKIYWFSPLSFTPATKKAYSDLWNEISVKYLKSKSNNIINLTESEAPFYYLFKNATINNNNSVITIDIGGGSSDFMLHNQNKPILASSVHFGANVLWGNGFNDFRSEKSNGIYLSLKDTITANLKSTDLKRMNEIYCASDDSFAGSDEIINFWIANDDKSKILSKLKSGDFRLSYLLHTSALIYYILKLINLRNQKPPTCIIYSGNGSQYLKLIDEVSFIEKIWWFFGKKIFGPDCVKPQVVLPSTNGKEATCYGGLFAPSTPVSFSKENYLGLEKETEKALRYKDIDENMPYFFDNILKSVQEFINWFFEMNDVPDLNFKDELAIEIKLEPVKKFLLDKAQENLNLGYTKRVKVIDKDDLISDSPFFYPFVGLIYKLNKLTSDEISQLTPKTTLYCSSPDAENEFLESRISANRLPDSIYTITTDESNFDSGILNIIDEQSVHKRALAVYQGYLNPVCVYESYPEPGQSIKVISPGKIKKNGQKWVVTEKIKIEFV